MIVGSLNFLYVEKGLLLSNCSLSCSCSCTSTVIAPSGRKEGGCGGRKEREERERGRGNTLVYDLLAVVREGWEARALLGFFESKRHAKENINRHGRRPPPRRRR